MPSQPTFIVIGAQKSATTSIYNWLRQHPQIFLSAQKELDFFSQTDLYAQGFDHYRNKWFSDIGTATAVGDVSPQYMLSGEAPVRIARHLPNVKLVALLRNPIDRAMSHYAMLRKWGTEQRNFTEAANVYAATGHELIDVNHTNFLVAGLYGAILGRYLTLFPKRALCVTFYEELTANPREQLSQILEFIGVDSNFVPDNLGNVFNRGAEQRRFPRFEDWMLRQRAIKRTIKALVPPILLSKFLFWFDTEFNVNRSAPTDGATVTFATRQMLADYFRSDVARLEDLIGRNVPWTEFRSGAPARTPSVAM